MENITPMEDFDFKYTEDGQQVVVLEVISDSIKRIEFVYENGDGEPYMGKSQLWDKPLFDSPPVPRLHELAEKMTQQLDQQREQRKALDLEIKELKSRKSALETEFSSIPGLQNIVDFLKNPPTHFILQKWHYPYIVPIDQCKVEYSTLATIGVKTGYGMKEPQVQWWVRKKKENSYDYHDSEDGTPCNGLEDAKAKLKVALKQWVAKGGFHYNVSIINMLRENGIEVPRSVILDGIASLNSEYDKIGTDVETQKTKKRGEINQWEALLMDKE